VREGWRRVVVGMVDRQGLVISGSGGRNGGGIGRKMVKQRRSEGVALAKTAMGEINARDYWQLRGLKNRARKGEPEDRERKTGWSLVFRVVAIDFAPSYLGAPSTGRRDACVSANQEWSLAESAHHGLA
jgi:hypothetical protein